MYRLLGHCPYLYSGKVIRYPCILCSVASMSQPFFHTGMPFSPCLWFWFLCQNYWWSLVRCPRTLGVEQSSCWTVHTGHIAGRVQKQTEDFFIRCVTVDVAICAIVQSWRYRNGWIVIFAHRSDCQRSMLSCKQGSSEQDCKVWHTLCLSHLFASGSWNCRHLEPVRHRANPRNW